LEIADLIMSKSKTDGINRLNTHGTALHLACKNNNLEAVNILFRYEANPTLKNKEGKLPIDLCTND